MSNKEALKIIKEVFNNPESSSSQEEIEEAFKVLETAISKKANVAPSVDKDKIISDFYTEINNMFLLHERRYTFTKEFLKQVRYKYVTKTKEN